MSYSSQISRRQFLQNTFAGTASVTISNSLLHVADANTVQAKRPNVLVIMSDEHNRDICGCYGNRLAQTPNIDSLAYSGVTFENAYCNSPQCAPSRLSFTAGKYIHHVSAWSNESWLPSGDIVSLPRVMNGAGYDSILCGKMHYDRSRRYGFKDITGLFTNDEIKSGKGRRPKPSRLKARPVSPRFSEIGPGDSSIVMSHDQHVTQAATRFLKNRTVADKPFFMLAGFLAPHPPFVVPDKVWENYRDAVESPYIPDGFFESLPLNYKHLRARMGMIGVDPKTVKLGREMYYGLTEWLDTEIGKVLEALRENDLVDNTVVIYVSDHGENMGEHGFWFKKTMYEQSAGVPMIISWPQRWRGDQRRHGACSLLDLAQTIVELGGGAAPGDWDGDSMVGWMDDPHKPWKDLAVSQYYGGHIASGYAMARQGRYKYVYHTEPNRKIGAERELYDLVHDPMEFENLAGDRGQQDRIKVMHDVLVKELGEDPDETEQRCRVERRNGYHHL